jgi:thiol-disulfide isomerase/thioredoxin
MADSPVEGSLPSLAGATGWLNSPPVTAADLGGHVVLVNFWTYTCINWLRQLPYVRAWAERYKDHGLVVIGVHTPEFDVEHHLDNLRRAATDLRVDYPIVVDNDYAIWDAFGNRYWPALYFVDAQGQIRHHRFGEGDYEHSEATIQRLLTEAGAAGIGQDLVSVDPGGVEAAADWDSLWSPENYLGYQRAENFASPNGAVLGTHHLYAAPHDWPLTIGPWQATGRCSHRPSCSTRPRGGSSTASTPATCTWSWERQHEGPPCGSTCASTGSPRKPPTEPT